MSDYNVNAQDLLQILKEIAVATDLLQSSTCKLADVVCILKTLETKLKSSMDENEDIRKIVEERFQKILRAPHFAAFFLSPTHKDS